jgi:hypothetical protein
MHELTPKQPHWRKRRWWGVGLLCFFVANQLSFGPMLYCHHRRWVPHSVYYYYCFYGVPDVIPQAVGEAAGLWVWNQWWDNLGRVHTGRGPSRY